MTNTQIANSNVATAQATSTTGSAGTPIVKPIALNPILTPIINNNNAVTNTAIAKAVNSSAGANALNTVTANSKASNLYASSINNHYALLNPVISNQEDVQQKMKAALSTTLTVAKSPAQSRREIHTEGMHVVAAAKQQSYQTAAAQATPV